MILWDRRVLIIGLVSVLVLLPFMVIIFKWAPAHTGWVFANPTQSSVWLPSRWTYYAQKLLELFTTPLLCLAGSSIVITMMDQQWRQEVKPALIWAIVVYIGFSYIEAKEARYVLLLGPPLVFMGVIGLVSCLRWVATQLGGNPTGFFLAGMAALLGLHAWIAPLVRVPLVNEFQG